MPVLQFRFRDEAEREAHVADMLLAARHCWKARRRRATRNQPHTIEVGHLLFFMELRSNENHFHPVTAIIGKPMVEVREVAQIRADGEVWATGSCMPHMDEFIGETMRHKVGRNQQIDPVKTAPDHAQFRIDAGI